MIPSEKDLLSFLEKATQATYAGNGVYEKTPERAGFHELIFQEGNLFYRDSYSGYIRSWGEELVRYKDKPIWTSLYGGGMVAGKESLADVTFEFLKKVLSIKEKGIFSARGPEHFEEEDWKHTYQQTGSYANFSGYQEIFYQGELVFYHHVIGGLILQKETSLNK